MKKDIDEKIVNRKAQATSKRAVSFVSASKLVSAVSVTIDPVDSLEVTRKNSNGSEDDDDKYCDNVVLSKF